MFSRRNVLTLAMRAAALPGGAEFFSAWLRGADDHSHAPPEAAFLRDYQPKFFEADDFAALQAFTEILIPTDSTPGAHEAHCAHYIDYVMHAAEGVAPQMQKPWRDAMEALKQMGFHAADSTGRARMVERMSNAAHPAFLLIKQLNTFAFYTSRAGSIEALDYKGNSFNATFPACTHPQHRVV